MWNVTGVKSPGERGSTSLFVMYVRVTTSQDGAKNRCHCEKSNGGLAHQFLRWVTCVQHAIKEGEKEAAEMRMNRLVRLDRYRSMNLAERRRGRTERSLARKAVTSFSLLCLSCHDRDHEVLHKSCFEPEVAFWLVRARGG